VSFSAHPLSRLIHIENEMNVDSDDKIQASHIKQPRPYPVIPPRISPSNNTPFYNLFPTKKEKTKSSLVQLSSEPFLNFPVNHFVIPTHKDIYYFKH
jgi:hypothetical protein